MRNNILKTIIFSLLLMLFHSTILIASTMIEADSRIKNVFIYPDSALVERVTSLNLEKGSHEIIFPNIVSEIDENSLRISVSGEAIIQLFGAKVKKEYLEEIPSERINKLKGEIRNLEDQIKKLQNKKSLLSVKKNFLDSIVLFSEEQIPKEMVTKLPATDDLKTLLIFLDEELTTNYSEVFNCDIEMRNLNGKLSVLKKELSQISGVQKKLKRSIITELEVLKSGKADLAISYMVNDASWNPIYDARADFAGSSVELISYGVIRQISGEDWVDVNAVLSTAKPRIGGNLPYVSPWILKPYEADFGAERTLEMPSVTYQKQAFRMEEEISDKNLSEVKYATAKEKGITVSYQIPYTITVKADKSENKFPISSQILEADFEYFTYPRLSPFAYLGSRVVNSQSLQLLAGQVNIFLEGNFVGASQIENIAPGEEFDLYLGIDENVKVTRNILEKKVDKTLIAGIPSRTKKTTFKYKLSVKNHKSKKIKIKLFEALPVSEDDRIKIKVDEISHEPDEKDWDDRKGIWLWKLDLESQHDQEIYYSFTVEHPRDMELTGL